MEVRELKTLLKSCDTLQDVFSILENTYQLDKARLGIMSRPLIIEGIIKAVKILNPPEK